MNRSVFRLGTEDIPAHEAKRLRAPLEHEPTVTIGDVTIKVSDHARATLIKMLDEIATGHEVDIIPVSEMLSTQEAADLLRVSRPTLVKMLEAGLLDYEQPGVHRKVSRTAIEEFTATRRQRREVALDEVAQTHDPDGPDEFVSTR